MFAGIGLATAAPLILHGHASPDCNPTIELCAVSDALYLPDDPAPRATADPDTSGGWLNGFGAIQRGDTSPGPMDLIPALDTW